MGRKKSCKAFVLTISLYQLSWTDCLLNCFSLSPSFVRLFVQPFPTFSVKASFSKKNFTKDQYNSIPQHMLESKANKYTTSWRTFLCHLFISLFNPFWLSLSKHLSPKNFTKDQYNTIPQHMLESKANKYTTSWRTFGVYHPQHNNDKGKDKQLATEHNWREEYGTLPLFFSVFFQAPP